MAICPPVTNPYLICLGYLNKPVEFPGGLKAFLLEVNVFWGGSNTLFKLVCVMENNDRWKNTKIPNNGRFLEVIGDLVGVLLVDKECLPCLTLKGLGFLYSPRENTAGAQGSIPSTPATNRRRRQQLEVIDSDGSGAPSTKRICFTTNEEEPTTPTPKGVSEKAEGKKSE